MAAKYSVAAGIALLATAFGAKFVAVAQSAGPQFEQVRVIEGVQSVPAQSIEDALPSPEESADASRHVDGLDSREATIAAREKELDDREDMLKAFEARISTQVEELKRHRDSLADVRDSIVGQQTEDVRKLAFMYGNMKARDAAEVMAVLPVEAIVRIIDGMSDVQATALLGALPPETAKEVTRSMLARGPDKS